MQVGKFLKFDKVCCILILETKVLDTLKSLNETDNSTSSVDSLQETCQNMVRLEYQMGILEGDLDQLLYEKCDPEAIVIDNSTTTAVNENHLFC